jgi:hypothetical protein
MHLAECPHCKEWMSRRYVSTHIRFKLVQQEAATWSVHTTGHSVRTFGARCLRHLR